MQHSKNEFANNAIYSWATVLVLETPVCYKLDIGVAEPEHDSHWCNIHGLDNHWHGPNDCLVHVLPRQLATCYRLAFPILCGRHWRSVHGLGNHWHGANNCQVHVVARQLATCYRLAFPILIVFPNCLPLHTCVICPSPFFLFWFSSFFSRIYGRVGRIEY